MDLEEIVQSMKGYLKDETIADFIALTKRFGEESQDAEKNPLQGVEEFRPSLN